MPAAPEVVLSAVEGVVTLSLDAVPDTDTLPDTDAVPETETESELTLTVWLWLPTPAVEKERAPDGMPRPGSPLSAPCPPTAAGLQRRYPRRFHTV